MHRVEHDASEEDDALDQPPPPSRPSTRDPFAEFEDEMEGESTRIDDSQLLAEQSTAILESAPVQPFLYVEKGNDRGREFVLQEGENGIGRGIDNDVILADVAVSRRHLIVIREGSTLRLRDLGSGNGTTVNGRRAASMVLSEGDRLELGESILVVRLPNTPHTKFDPDAAATDESNIGGLPAPSDPFLAHPAWQLTPSSTSTEHALGAQKNAIVLPRGLFIALVVGVLFMLGVLAVTVILLAVRMKSERGQRAEVTTVDASAFDRGVRAYEARDWDGAERAFREALESPSPDPRARAYLARARGAKSHRAHLEQARAALARGDGNAAFNQASAIPDDSPLAAEAQELERTARAAQVTQHLAASRAALAQGQRDEARRLHALARGIDPQNAEVQTLGAQIEGRSPQPATTPATAPSQTRAEESGGSTSPTRSQSQDGASNERGATPSEAIDAYTAGRFEQAAQLARAAAGRSRGEQQRSLQQLASNIESFARLYQRIQAARFSASARAEMEQAIAIDRRITRHSQYRSRLASAVIDIYLTSAERQRSNPVASCTNVRQALLVDSTNTRAQQMNGQCEAQARTMLREAASAPPDRASVLYRNVLLMVPNSSPVARQANERLQTGRRLTVVDEDE